MKNIDSKKVMRWMTWTAVFLLVVVVSNKVSNDAVINIGEIQAYVLGFVAIEMLLIGLMIAFYHKCKSYIVFTCLTGLVSAAQFHAHLPAVQMYSLAGIGMIALCRWLYPEFVKHRDEETVASVTQISDRRGGGSM